MKADVIDQANDLAAQEIENILRARANESAKTAAGPALLECEECGDDMPAVRVAMRARLCVPCQERADRIARMYAKK